MSAIEKAVELTLFHAGLYNYPLQKEQLWQRWVGDSCKYTQMEKALRKLVQAGVVLQNKTLYYLSYQNVEIDEFYTRKQISQEKIKKSYKLWQFLQKLPTITAVAITGSVAIGNARKDDDIDILVFTKSNQLYIARLVIFLYSVICGRRRTNDHQNQRDKWCFNLWLEEDRLQLPIEKQTLFSAIEFLQMKFVFDKTTMQKEFWEVNNNWLKEILPNLPQIQKIEVKKSSIKKSTLNNILGKWQKKKMQKKITEEIIDEGQLFFHPRPTRLKDKEELQVKQQDFLTHLQIDEKGELPIRVGDNLQKWQKEDKRIVLATGFFDLLHNKHVEFLQKAKKVGDILIVGVEPDSRGKRLKGQQRPVRGQTVRYGRLKRLGFVDDVFILPSDFGDKKIRKKMLQSMQPDFLAVSSTSPHLQKKKEEVEALGITLEEIPMKDEGVSTSAIIEGKKKMENLIFEEDKDLIKEKK